MAICSLVLCASGWRYYYGVRAVWLALQAFAGGGLAFVSLFGAAYGGVFLWPGAVFAVVAVAASALISSPRLPLPS